MAEGVVVSFPVVKGGGGGGGETSIFRGTLPYAIVCLKTQRVRAKQNKLKF